jgi:hypothetical protein
MNPRREDRGGEPRRHGPGHVGSADDVYVAVTARPTNPFERIKRAHASE